MSIQFTKMQSLGNDFVVIDATAQTITPTIPWIQHIADRHLGVGCDQVLLLTKTSPIEADFGYRIFNADGKEVYQCGNGARCMGLFAQRLTGKNNFVLATKTHSLRVRCEDSKTVSVDMPTPNFDPTSLPGDINDASFKKLPYLVQLVSLGNPHAVITESLTDNELIHMGKTLNACPAFPEGVNVEIAQVVSRGEIRLRVYERGVGLTQACGSGACAAAAVLRKAGLIENEVVIHQPGGALRVTWDGTQSPMRAKGPANFVFEGVWID